MAGRRPKHFVRQESEGGWPGFVISIAVTAASFAAAFGAMTSLTDRTDHGSSKRDSTIILRLPAPVAVPRAVVPSTTRRPVRVPLQRPTAPVEIPNAVAPVAPKVAPTPRTAPIGEPTASRDSSNQSSGKGAPTTPTGKGAPMAPSGVTLGARTPNTPAVRDSIAREKMAGIPELARTHAPTGAERQELEESQRLARLLRQRTTTAGNTRDLVILQGSGKDGVGAVGGPGMISVPFTLFSSGPSPEQRKKNEKLDADYQLRLRRLQDRMYLKQDSVRADSVRADSLRRDSLASKAKPSKPFSD